MNCAILICVGIASALAAEPVCYPNDILGLALRQKETQTVVRELEQSLMKELGDLKREIGDLHAENKDFRNQIANLTQQIAGNESNAPVAFFATLSSHFTPTSSQTIVFNNNITDVGWGYNPGTGVFTAPSDGLYVFSTSVTVELSTSNNTYAHFSIRKNDSPVAWLYVNDSDGDYETASGTVPLSLEEGDTVKVYGHSSGGTVRGSNTFFSGFKL